MRSIIIFFCILFSQNCLSQTFSKNDIENKIIKLEHYEIKSRFGSAKFIYIDTYLPSLIGEIDLEKAELEFLNKKNTAEIDDLDDILFNYNFIFELENNKFLIVWSKQSKSLFTFWELNNESFKFQGFSKYVLVGYFHSGGVVNSEKFGQNEYLLKLKREWGDAGDWSRNIMFCYIHYPDYFNIIFNLVSIGGANDETICKFELDDNKNISYQKKYRESKNIVAKPLKNLKFNIIDENEFNFKDLISKIRKGKDVVEAQQELGIINEKRSLQRWIKLFKKNSEEYRYIKRLLKQHDN